MTDLVPLRVVQSHEHSSTAAMAYLGNLRPSGRRSMRGALARLGLLFTGEAVDVVCVPWHLVRYEHVAAARAILQHTYAPATVNKHLTALRGVVRECWRFGLIDGDVLARVIDVPNVKGKRLPAGRMLEEQELRTLWAVAGPLGARYAACLALLFSGGLRRSEAAELTWDCVDTTIAADGAETIWLTVEGKGGKERRVPLRGTAACRISTLAREAQAKGDPRWGSVLGVCDRGVAKMVEKLVVNAGIAHASCHDLRRSFVSHALAGGAPIADVARVAGHSDPRTTAGYDRRADDALVGVADALPS